MTYPGVALMVMVGVGIGAFLYYMFADNNDHARHQYSNGGGGGDGYNNSFAEPHDSWRSNQNERTRRRKRGSVVSAGKSSCTICLVDLVDQESIQLFPCKHEFHKSCITKWREQGPAEARNTCPNCREGIFGSSM